MGLQSKYMLVGCFQEGLQRHAHKPHQQCSFRIDLLRKRLLERACVLNFKKQVKNKSIPKVKVKKKSNQQISKSQKKSQIAQARLFLTFVYLFFGVSFF